MASLVDWNQFATPPASMAPGMSALADALAEVQARRQAKAAAQAAADAKLAEQIRTDSRAQAVQAETARHNQATEGASAANSAREDKRMQVDAYGRAVPLLQAGEATLARPFLARGTPPPSANDLVTNLLGESAGIPPLGQPPGAPSRAPDPLSVSPPPWVGDGPPPLTAPPPAAAPPAMAPPPPMDLADVTIQGVERDRAAKQARELERMKPFEQEATASPYARDAYEYTKRVAASGQVGKESLAKVFNDRRQFLESQAGMTERARMAAAAKPSTGLVDDKRKLDIEQEYTDRAAKVLSTLGYTDVVKNERKLQDLATQVAGANDNAALAAIVAGSFTKMAQGGTGVVSDNDLKVFWERIGGLGIRTKQAFDNAISGQLGKDKQAIVKRSVEALIGAAKGHEKEFGRALETDIGAMPGGKERLPRILSTFTPGYNRDYSARQAQAGDAAALKTIEDEADAELQRIKGRR